MKIDREAILTAARQVFEIESDALIQCARDLKPNFADAVNILHEIRGKVILTGLGKSGHVARKIAATLSSTGTAACFLHPTEALHGDLGMVGIDDAVIAVAQGGETEEVIEVARFAKRRSLRVIGITGKPESSLAMLSDIILSSGVTKEACPLGLAPTTSTTVAMAWGDALAVCLMNVRGFKAENFAHFHPRGSLGKRLAVVSDHMRSLSEMAPIGLQDSFHTVLEKVTHQNFGVGVVLEVGGKLAGAITDGDLRRALIKYEGRIFDMTAAELMTATPKTILSTLPSIQAIQMMENLKITSLMVVSQDFQLLGILRLHDLLAAKIV